VIVAVPTETGLAKPPLVVMVAILGELDDQVASEVTLLVDPSEKVAVAVNCWLCARLNDIVALAGVTEMLVTVLLLTVRIVEAETLLLDFAVIVVVPSATPVANPELSMVAMPVVDEVQVTCEVTSPVLLLPKVAVALNCWVAFGMTKGPVGEIASETIVSFPGKKPEQLLSKIARGNATANFQNHECPDIEVIPTLPTLARTWQLLFLAVARYTTVYSTPHPKLRRAAPSPVSRVQHDCSAGRGMKFRHHGGFGGGTLSHESRVTDKWPCRRDDSRVGSLVSSVAQAQVSWDGAGPRCGCL
jgi:hypothetical protein